MSHPSDLYQQIGKQIQELRRRKGITQSKLANVLALNRTSITNIEKGRQKILIHTLWDLADALGVPLNSLLPEQKNSPIENELRFPKNISKDEENWIRIVLKGSGRHGNSKKID